MKSQIVLALAIASMGINSALYAKAFKLADTQTSIELKSQPKKIAVYDLSILDTLNALKIKAQLVPETTYFGSLASYQHNQTLKAGTLFEPKLDVLKKAQPDLILIGGRSAKHLETLSQIAPTLNLSPNTTHYIDDLKARTLSLAKAFDREKIATQKLAEVDQLLNTLHAKTQGQSALMLFAAGENFMPHAANDRFGYVHELSGWRSVLPLTDKSVSTPRAEAGSPEALAQAQKNLELLKSAVDQNPDYIIVLDRGAVNTQKYTAQDKIEKHEILSQAEAVKNRKVIYVNADAWYLTGAGLDNTIFMLKELLQKIDKQA